MHVQCLCLASCTHRWHKNSSIWGYILRMHKNSSTENNQILTPNQMFQWATQNIVGIIFSTLAMKKLQAISKLMSIQAISILSYKQYQYIRDEEVTSNIKAYELKQRYSRWPTVPGTRSHHCFIPQSKSTLAMKRLSSDKEGVKVKLYNDDNVTLIQLREQLHRNLQPEKYVASLYHSVWYIGAVIERSDQNKVAYIKFMKRNHLVSTLPQDLQNDYLWQAPFTDILTIVAPP